jgi:hypothetical protein
VGFEHEAHSDEDRAALAAAADRLKQPFELFVMPESAGCTLVAAHVEMLDEAHEAETHEEEDAHHDEEENAHHGEAGEHGEFHAEYELGCSDIGAIDRINFPYFEAFPGAESLTVTLLSDAGQSVLSVSRDNPVAGIEAGQ